MGEVVKYKVVAHRDELEGQALNLLQERVNKWIDDGWKPIGGVSLAQASPKWVASGGVPVAKEPPKWIASQAMVKIGI